jgi:nicotinate-nucleotide adenylyltransferase
LSSLSRAFPIASPGERIGLFGGSFDPAHEGHAHVASTAMKRLGLQRVWWLVSPQNPLKARRAGDMEARIAGAERFARGPRQIVTAGETALGIRYTAETIAALRRLRPGVRFVWIMGGDSLAGFHRWQRWRSILESFPVCIVSRPGFASGITRAPAPAHYPNARVPADETLADRPAPAWCFIPARFVPVSSSALRAAMPGRG